MTKCPIKGHHVPLSLNHHALNINVTFSALETMTKSPVGQAEE